MANLPSADSLFPADKKQVKMSPQDAAKATIDVFDPKDDLPKAADMFKPKASELFTPVADKQPPKAADLFSKDKGFVQQREEDILGGATDMATAGAKDIMSAFKKDDYKPTDFDKNHPILGPFLHGAAQPFRPLMGIAELEGAAPVGALEGVTKPIERTTGLPSWASDMVLGVASPAMAKRAVSKLTGADSIIESAAIKDGDKIYKGDNHELIRQSMPEGSKKGADANTGFVTKSGKFIDRETAQKLAKANGQFKKEVKGPNELHSEELRKPEEMKPSIVSKVTTPIKKILAPASVSADAGRTAAIKRETLGQATRDVAASTARLEPYRARMSKLTPEERNKFIDHMEGRGPKLEDPQLQAAADELKANYKLRADKIKGTKSLAKTGLYKDYLTRSFTGTEAQRGAMILALTKQGTGKNLRARQYATYQEAEAAAAKSGMKPKFDNFIDQANDYNANMDMYIAHNQAFDMLKKEGYIKYGPVNGRKPEGWVPLKGRLATKTGLDKKSGSPITVQAYAPEDVARVYNNFLSEGLTGDAGKAMRTTQQVFNTITQLKLGLANVYHAGITGTAAISSDLARGTRQALKGEPLAGAKTIAKAPFAPYRVAHEGSKFNKQWLRLNDYGPNTEKLVDIATRANILQSKRPSYMDSAGPKTMKELFSEAKTKPLTGSAKIFGEGVGKTMQKISGPMFDKWIPDMKRGVIIERLQQWIKEHPNSTEEQQLDYARKLGDSVDNRFGEMMRDNLFWNKTLRDGMQLGFLSYSWVAGATRMLAGAAKEGAATLTKGEELGPNAEYLLANAVTATILNSAYQYIHTGTALQDPKDAFFPKTGGTQQVGKSSAPERAVLPTGHWTQIAEYMHDPLAELYNEGNIGAKVFYDAMMNEDYRGLPIAKPMSLWDPNWEKEIPDAMWRYGQFLAGQALTPIAIQSYYSRNKDTGIKPAETIGMAARPAPGFITDPDAVEGMERRQDQRAWTSKLKSDNRMGSRRESNQPAEEKPKAEDLFK